VASGGGYGDPLERDPVLVRNDVENSIVSRDGARQVYGVVFNDNGLQIDIEATHRLRAQMRKQEIEEGR
jgi:N-methylhydantoinase B/oxoprolinase/acetone carboxylase alpha subunit